MKLTVRIDSPVPLRWHTDLVDRLSGVAGVDASLWRAPARPGREDRRLRRLMALERRLHRLDPPATRPADPDLLDRQCAARPAKVDRVLDLTALPAADGTWRVTYDGVPGDQALLDALRRGRLPLVRVLDETGEPVASGRPGSEQPGLLASCWADVLAGVATLVVGAVEGRRFAEPAYSQVEPAPPLGRPQPVGSRVSGMAARRLLGAAAHLGYRTLYRAPHWRVGWRFVDGPDVLDLLAQPASGWHDLPDDGYHFYADPFPFVYDGRTFLFVEDFDHRVGKGVISVVEYDASGPVGSPRPVLEHDVHLSYPFVVEHDGQVWMIPETCAAGTVELYRATRFPDSWERESVLLEGPEASDTTPFVHDGRWWLAATVREGGSFSDSLHLWSADDLRGPWHPHPANPVLVDIASARPAGRVVLRDGRLLRPTQDGREGYGAALTLTEITRLDDDAFEQRVVAHLGPGESWPGRRLHTLNRAGDLEVVDGSAMSPRLGRRFPR
jgi:hypothetical protein